MKHDLFFFTSEGEAVKFYNSFVDKNAPHFSVSVPVQQKDMQWRVTVVEYTLD